MFDLFCGFGVDGEDGGSVFEEFYNFFEAFSGIGAEDDEEIGVIKGVLFEEILADFDEIFLKFVVLADKVEFICDDFEVAADDEDGGLPFGFFWEFFGR